ncbi:MAG: DUF5320 domain-containing protein [Bacteroidales bacterium]|nr:DUF5320 domain-containing protein [Bacteroidales bacterium]
MPGFDQTGPEGKGPMTGRRLGRCTNYGEKSGSKDKESNNDIENLPPGRGAGRGSGPGRGRGAGGGGRGRGRGTGLQNRFRGGQ